MAGWGTELLRPRLGQLRRTARRHAARGLFATQPMGIVAGCVNADQHRRPHRAPGRRLPRPALPVAPAARDRTRRRAARPTRPRRRLAERGRGGDARCRPPQRPRSPPRPKHRGRDVLSARRAKEPELDRLERETFINLFMLEMARIEVEMI